MKHGGTTHRNALVQCAGRSFCCDSPAHLAKCSWPAVAWQSNNTRPFFVHAVALFRTVWRRVITLALFAMQPCMPWLLLGWLATLALN